MDITPLMNEPRKMNAHYISKQLTNATIFPESAELPYLDKVNQQEFCRAGNFLESILHQKKTVFRINATGKQGGWKLPITVF